MRIVVEVEIIGDIGLVCRQFPFNHRVATVVDFDGIGAIDHRADVTILTGCCGECQEAVDPCNESGVDLYGRYVANNIFQQGGIDTVLEGDDLLLCTQDLLLIYFQLFGDVTLGTHQCLLADPSLRHLLLVGVADFYVVSENIVESHFQRGDPGALAFTLLQLHQVVFAAVGNLSQFVELLIYSLADESPLVHQCRGVGGDFFFNALS